MLYESFKDCNPQAQGPSWSDASIHPGITQSLPDNAFSSPGTSLLMWRRLVGTRPESIDLSRLRICNPHQPNMTAGEDLRTEHHLTVKINQKSIILRSKKSREDVIWNFYQFWGSWGLKMHYSISIQEICPTRPLKLLPMARGTLMEWWLGINSGSL